MSDNNNNSLVNEKDTKKNLKTLKDIRTDAELELITAYAQMAFFTLQKSEVPITPRLIKVEIKMLYEKFGDSEIKRLAKLFLKDKK